MKLLIIGGTVFLGRAVVEEALTQGHEVTLFNRGQSNSTLFPDTEQIHGDRDGGLSALSGRTFDACLDTCGYIPRIVAASAQLLRNAVHAYAFVSSVSVYGEPFQKARMKTAPLLPWTIHPSRKSLASRMARSRHCAKEKSRQRSAIELCSFAQASSSDRMT